MTQGPAERAKATAAGGALAERAKATTAGGALAERANATTAGGAPAERAKATGAGSAQARGAAGGIAGGAAPGAPTPTAAAEGGVARSLGAQTPGTDRARPDAAQAWQAFTGAVGDKKEPLPAAPATNFSQHVRDNFGTWDADHNGWLARGEIDTLMSDPSIQGNDAAALATLKRKYDDFVNLHDDRGFDSSGVTLRDVASYERAVQDGGNDTSRSVDANYAHAQSRIRNTSPALFNGDPDPRAVKQGGIGDCYFIAAAAAKAGQDPAGIRNMIQDNGNGTYAVTFPGHDPLTVSALTDAEKAFYATSGQNGQWMGVLEKGYGQYRNGQRWSQTSVPQDAADGGAMLTTGIDPLTSRSLNTDTLALTGYGTTRDRLEAAMTDQRMVTAGIRKALPWENGQWDGIQTGHAYSVLGYDRATDTITVRNPWGHGERTNAQGGTADGVNDGVFQMSLTDFYKYFSNIAYEQ